MLVAGPAGLWDRAPGYRLPEGPAPGLAPGEKAIADGGC